MNSLEAEYSFLAPTWKLPTVATSSMYSRPYGTTYLSGSSDYGPDLTFLNNTRYNSRYVSSFVSPPTMRRNYPLSTNYQRSLPSVISSETQNFHQSSNEQHAAYSGPSHLQQGNKTFNDDGLNLTISVHPNNDFEHHSNNYDYNQSKHQQVINRDLTYPTNQGQKRRVQIIDHNRQTPSTVINEHLSERNSRNSNRYFNQTPDTNRSQSKSKSQNRDHNDENKSLHNSNHGTIHDYLYGLAAPDPGSYVNAFKNQQRRLQDEKVGRKSVMNEYKSFAHSGGFGPDFSTMEHQNHKEKVEIEQKKKNYSRFVRESNQYKIDEQKRIQSLNGSTRTRNAPVPKSQRAREYAEKIEKPHHLKPVVRLRDPNSGNVIIRDAPDRYRHRLDS